MRKIVVNNCHGGFCLSWLALKRLFEIKNPGKTFFYYRMVSGEDKPSWYPQLYKIVYDDDDFKSVHGFLEGYLYASEDFLGESFRMPIFISYMPIVQNGLSDVDKKIIDDASLFCKQHNIITICQFDYERHDDDLIRVVLEMGDSANGRLSELKIEEIGDNELYDIDEYDGKEYVVTKESALNRRWR